MAKTLLLFIPLFIIQFGSDPKKIVWGVAFWNVCSHMVTYNKKEKKNRKNVKIENFEKKNVWRYGG